MTEPPPGWESTDGALSRVIRASGLEAESLQERLRATAASAGREVDVREDDGELVVRLPLSGGDSGDSEVARRLDEVIEGGGDVANPG